MSSIRADRLSQWTSGRWFGKVPEMPIRGFGNDTRRLMPGQGFVALSTNVRDGHDYVANAAVCGASMALVSRELSDVSLPQFVVEDALLALQEIAHAWRMEFEGPVVGITGSCGKTTTKDLLKLLLGEHRVHATPYNLNNYLGLPLTLCGIDPDIHEAAIIEAGINKPGEMARLAQILSPDISIITMIGHAHLEKLGTLENVAREKSQLGVHTRDKGKVLFPSSCCEYDSFSKFKGRGLVLMPEGEDMLCQNPEEVIPYEIGNAPDDMKMLTLWRNSETPSRFTVPAWGPGMMNNAALSITAASLLGASDMDIQQMLSLWRPSSQRGEIRRSAHALYFIDCYNANPDSFAESFSVFRSRYPHLPRLYVLGCMKELGEQSERLHYETGLSLKIRAQDRVFVIGDFADVFRQGIIDSGARAEQVIGIDDRDTLKNHVQNFEGQILLKGSRAYALEQLLPESSTELGQEEIAC